MSKSDSKSYNRPLGAKAYAAISEVEGVRLSDAGRKRLSGTKHLSQDERRAEVLRAYKTAKPTRK
jgi:hypothetical protein